MVTSVTKGGTQIFKIVETYGHDHSLERSWGALSGGTISFSIQPFPGGMHFVSLIEAIVSSYIFFSLFQGCGHCFTQRQTPNQVVLVGCGEVTIYSKFFVHHIVVCRNNLKETLGPMKKEHYFFCFQWMLLHTKYVTGMCCFHPHTSVLLQFVCSGNNFRMPWTILLNVDVLIDCH
jgi:hypothetical protein